MSIKHSLFYVAQEVIHVIAFPAEEDAQKAIVATLLEGLAKCVPVTLDPSNPDPNVIVGVTRTSWAMLGEEVLYVCLNISPYQTSKEYLSHCEAILCARGFTNASFPV